MLISRSTIFRSVIVLTALASALSLNSRSWADDSKPARPNIVLIYADDLGYGDVGCYGATKIATPHIDRLAADGLRFTDAHCTASTCTPSRYSLLTGEYAFRNRRARILPADAPLLIDPKQHTLPRMLQQAGYATGVVGKWHLGLGEGDVDWNGEIKPGPREVGFDYSFLIPATGDRVPCVYVENGRVVGLDPDDPIRVSYKHQVGDDPTGKQNPDLLKMKLDHGHDKTIVNGISRIGWMSGGQAARWRDEDMADEITRRATAFIEKHRDEPFFLYFATQDIHVPRVPHERFKGKTPHGPRGDVIVQLDWCVGQISATLERLGLAENTLVIFSSDNGPVLNDGYLDEAIEKLGDHRPAGPLRGTKYSRYEAGTRVPTIARWPGRIKPGTTSDALLCQTDLLVSISELVDQKVPDGAAADSQNLLPAWLGESERGREILVEQGIRGLAIRQGNWKFIPPNKGPRTNRAGADYSSNQPELYNLADDLAETTNLAEKHPERVKELAALLESLREGSGETK